jgi:putative phosphoribosyl transferase
MSILFLDRRSAGHELGLALERYRGASTLVLGLPRGGVVVAAEVAKVLGAQLDVILTRKIGAPGNPEYAIGAVAEGGGVVLNEREIALLGIGQAYVEEEIRREEQRIAERIDAFRQGAPLPPLRDHPVLVVDDGVATGYTMLAALRAARNQGAKPVVMAVPVAPPSTLERLAPECDDAVVLAAPDPFYAVGMFYQNFDQTSDEEVVQLLQSAKLLRRAA